MCINLQRNENDIAKLYLFYFIITAAVVAATAASDALEIVQLIVLVLEMISSDFFW